MNKTYDYLIVGAGIVGLTVAYELKKESQIYPLPLLKRKAMLRNTQAEEIVVFYMQVSITVQIV